MLLDRMGVVGRLVGRRIQDMETQSLALGDI
jgi:hypothetical protein